MAIFKVPRITTAQRNGITLDQAEIVYDSDKNVYFGGDSSTPGGFPLGKGGGTATEVITLTLSNITSKQVILSDTPLFPSSVTVLPIGGIPQIYGIDFTIIAPGNVLSWSGLLLENLLEVGETLIITY